VLVVDCCSGDTEDFVLTGELNLLGVFWGVKAEADAVNRSARVAEVNFIVADG